MKTKISIIAIIIIIVGISSSNYFINLSTSIDTSLPYKDYYFRIGELNNKIIRDMFLFYDFENEEGYFKFRTGGREFINDLNVDIPREFNLTNVKILNSSSGEEIYFTEKDLTIYNPGGISIRNLGERNIEVLINLTSKNNSFQPNGRFRFKVGGTSEVTLNDDLIEEHRGALLKFYFGDKYRCSEQCFIIERLSNESIASFPNQKWLLISADGNSKNIGDYVIFSITTYNLQKKERSNWFFGIGIGILSSILVAGIFFFLDLFLPNGKNNLGSKIIIPNPLFKPKHLKANFLTNENG